MVVTLAFQFYLPWSESRPAQARCLALLLLAVAVLPGCYGTQADNPSAEAAVVSDYDLGLVSTPMVAALLAQQAGDLDPLTDGWEAEALSEAAIRQLTVLADLMTHPKQLDAGHRLRPDLRPHFQCPVLH